MAAKRFRVSQSKVKTWRKCHYAYHLRYDRKLRSNKPARPLKFGSIVHSMLEAYGEGDDPFKVLKKIDLKEHKLFRAEREMYGEIIADIGCIMGEYFEHYDENSIVYTRIGKRYAEHEFTVGLTKDIDLTGKIDARVRTPNKLHWLAEHKTFNRMPNEDERWRNLQSCTYTRVVDMLGWPAVDGTLWDYIWSKPPTRPQIRKDGKAAKRSIITLPSRVREVLREERLKERDYQHLLRNAEKCRKDYFQRVFTPTKRHVVDKVFADLKQTAIMMRDTQGKLCAKNIDRHCSWCDFKDVCRAELLGRDPEMIIERNFHVEEREYQEVAAE